LILLRNADAIRRDLSGMSVFAKDFESEKSAKKVGACDHYSERRGPTISQDDGFVETSAGIHQTPFPRGHHDISGAVLQGLIDPKLHGDGHKPRKEEQSRCANNSIGWVLFARHSSSIRCAD
jgi:hypothetical protein